MDIKRELIDYTTKIIVIDHKGVSMKDIYSRKLKCGHIWGQQKCEMSLLGCILSWDQRKCFECRDFRESTITFARHVI